MKVVAIVQARLNSVRLPGKVMKQICGVPMIGLLLKRLSLAKKIDQIVVATSKCKSNDKLIKYIKNLNLSLLPNNKIFCVKITKILKIRLTYELTAKFRYKPYFESSLTIT